MNTQPVSNDRREAVRVAQAEAAARRRPDTTTLTPTQISRLFEVVVNHGLDNIRSITLSHDTEAGADCVLVDISSVTHLPHSLCLLPNDDDPVAV